MGEKCSPRYLAVDRPSVKLVSFLRKHYGLVNTIPQVKVLTFVDVGFQIASKIHSQRKSTIELKLSTIELYQQGILKAYV